MVPYMGAKKGSFFMGSYLPQKSDLAPHVVFVSEKAVTRTSNNAYSLKAVKKLVFSLLCSFYALYWMFLHILLSIEKKVCISTTVQSVILLYKCIIDIMHGHHNIIIIFFFWIKNKDKKVSYYSKISSPTRPVQVRVLPSKKLKTNIIYFTNQTRETANLFTDGLSQNDAFLTLNSKINLNLLHLQNVISSRKMQYKFILDIQPLYIRS
jgi:hypothetical protein